MPLKDPKALATPRSVTCEKCGLYCRRPTERHHIQPRGMGSGSRIDHPWNLIDLGGDFDCSCHSRAQANKITRRELYVIVARREKTTVRKILNLIARLNGRHIRSEEQQPWHRPKRKK